MTDPDPADATTGDTGLLIRVWREPGDPQRVRARVLSFRGVEAPRTCTLAADEHDLVNAVTAWVRDRLSEATSRVQGAAP